ncbi:serine/threonine-protein kinase [Nocardiopsis sp. RSe5-2]|uniref:non-specific serine/threonine protein kinase n=1 Tax=Nocardiopsis endophytica TaxID=3018445 RepID=A0ABT4U347_9ACTN|nr:serine/threonine-protein kinase [Nocardiopsis endophytica]MDA2811378.1 serine/threonine-protein kinase [Nocardiopsis endophytica]
MSDNDPGGGTPDDPTGLSGTVLSGRYQLDEQIGSGGMGTVWRATDTLLNRPVAVKLLHPAQMAEPTSRERFRTEGRITAGLSHPGIAQVYDYGEQDDRAYLIMELVPGEPLSSILKRNEGLEPGVTLDILSQSAAALAAAHARGVVHRDIKPGNLLVTDDGTVKLTDFGIARGDQSVTLTQTGMVMGTAQYISPEQASGRPATHASDIYALGVVAYECLAGQPPFTADSPLALALAHTREPPPPLPEHLPGPLTDLVEALLAKDPAERPESAGEVARAAQALRHGAPDLGATTAMDLTDPTRTVVADPAARRTATGSWSADRATSSDRLARGSGGPRSRLPLVIAAVVAAVAVVVGVAFAGALWNNDGQEGRNVGNSRDASPTATPTGSDRPTEQEQQDTQDDATGTGTDGTGGYTPPQTGGEPTITQEPPPSGGPDDDGGGTDGGTTPPPDDGGDTGGGTTPPPDDGGDTGGGDEEPGGGTDTGGGDTGETP